MTKIKQPKIRFKGYIDNWEQRKFSNIVNRVSQQSNDSNLPKVEFEDIISGEGRLNKDISNKFDDRKGTVFEPEFILYGKLRPYLKNWLFPNFKGIALGDFWVFEPNNSSSIFDYYLIQSEKYQTVANLTSGTKMPRSDWKTVSETEFSIPVTIEEQKKIGEFFKTLDDTIALYSKKLEVTKQFKQTMLKKMFHRNGETKPEIRFKGFTDDWKYEKFLDIFNKYSEKNINGFEQYTIGKKGVKKIEKDILYAVENHKIFKPNSLILGLGIEEMGVSEDIFGSCSPIYTTYNIKQANTLFIKYFINGFLNINKNKITKTSTRREFEIVIRDVEKLNLRLPNSQEQELIGNYFKELDNQIKALEQKLEKYKEFKKAMLQKMFI